VPVVAHCDTFVIIVDALSVRVSAAYERSISAYVVLRNRLLTIKTSTAAIIDINFLLLERRFFKSHNL
jgi:hypothetical protein